MKFNITLVLIVAVLAMWIGRQCKHTQKLERNQNALLSQTRHYKTKDSLNVASIEKLTLSAAQFKAKEAESAKLIKSLSLKLRRVESFSSQAIETTRTITDTLRLRDSLMKINYSDPYLSIEGHIAIPSVTLAEPVLKATIVSYDTLVQVVHRVPRKFWFIRFGTKAIRQEIVSKNPYTRVVYAEYVEFD